MSVFQVRLGVLMSTQLVLVVTAATACCQTHPTMSYHD